MAAIYSPVSNTESEAFLTDLNQKLRQYDNHIICGDFNCVIDPKNDKMSSSLFQPRTASINTMQKFIADFNLEHVYRKRNPDIQGFTWVQQHSGVAERIDMFLDVYRKRKRDIQGFTWVQQHSGVVERIDMFLDVYRKRKRDIQGFTWVQQHSGVVERIDMFLVLKTLVMIYVTFLLLQLHSVITAAL